LHAIVFLKWAVPKLGSAKKRKKGQMIRYFSKKKYDKKKMG